MIKNKSPTKPSAEIGNIDNHIDENAPQKSNEINIAEQAFQKNQGEIISNPVAVNGYNQNQNQNQKYSISTNSLISAELVQTAGMIGAQSKLS